MEETRVPSPAEVSQQVSEDERQQTTQIVDKAARRIEELLIELPEMAQSISPDDFEKLVSEKLNEAALGTAIEGRIEHLGGHAFPDIVVGRRWGIEVKTSRGRSKALFGNSIMESTRGAEVEDVLLLYGQLGADPKVVVRPYYDCVKDIKVTHSPRYVLNAALTDEENLFVKMGYTPEEFLRLDDPVGVIRDYYVKELQPGERLWWAGSTGEDESATPMQVRFWSNLDSHLKNSLIGEALVRYPELYGHHANYDRVSMWLVVEHSVVCPNIRDQFSGGGRSEVVLMCGTAIVTSRILVTLMEHSSRVLDSLRSIDSGVLATSWDAPVSDTFEDRIEQWIDLALEQGGGKVPELESILRTVVSGSADSPVSEW